MALKKFKQDSVFKIKEKTIITGFEIKLPSGQKVEYKPTDLQDSYFYAVNVETDGLDYQSLTICNDFLEVALNADENDFEAAIVDLRELRKAHYNLNNKLGII